MKRFYIDEREVTEDEFNASVRQGNIRWTILCVWAAIIGPITILTAIVLL